MSVSLNKIVDITVHVSNPVAITSDFNLGCIIGTSNSSKKGTVTIYSSSDYLAEMATDGYETSDPEVVKAGIYFSQNPNSARLAIAEYDPDDATINTPAKAFNMARDLNTEFYAVCFADSTTDSEIADVAAAVEASDVPTIYFYKSSSANCITADTTNVIGTLKNLGYMRSFGFYSADENIDAAMLGLVSGLNSMAANSAYTVTYKTLSGITPTDITDTQMEILQSYNGNAYNKFGNIYKFVYNGISAGGYYVDEIFGIDACKFLIQSKVVAGLTSARKIPMTESGVTRIVSFVTSACEDILNMGLIGAGVWTGEDVYTLTTGTALTRGYYVDAESVYNMTPAERRDRVSPPVYVALLFSGSLEHVIMNVYVTR